MLRAPVLALLLCGCDQALDLVEVTYVPDAPSADAPPTYIGCSDMTREGFTDPAIYADIAACAGAWSLPGLRDVTAACGRGAGNDGVLLAGGGCSAADLCAEGWHVCQTKLDVASSQPVGLRSCTGLGAETNMFFATAQGGPGGDCTQADATDDFMGCGTYGPAASSSCLPLDKTTGNMCFDLGVDVWNCPEYNAEVLTVTKTEPLIGGGVLCCKDIK